LGIGTYGESALCMGFGGFIGRGVRGTPVYRSALGADGR
jgi:hypothetical protein